MREFKIEPIDPIESAEAADEKDMVSKALVPVEADSRTLCLFQAKEFPHLSPATFQHPLDIQATQNLAKVPLLGTLMKKVSGSMFEQQMWLNNIANQVRIGPKQAPSIYRKFIRAAEILDVQKLPQIFISSAPIINATAFGMENYQITLYAGLIDILTEEELFAIVGHELGHVKCQHMLFKSLAYILRTFGLEILNSLLPAGTGSLASIPLQLALLHWDRMAEFSCDRAALLVVQDPEVVASALAKLAGGSHRVLPELELDGILEQAQLYQESGDGLLAKMLKIQMMMLQTHPFPIVRAQKIMEWAESEAYQAILRGEYPSSAPQVVMNFSDPVALVCPAQACKHWNQAGSAFCVSCGCNLRSAGRICTNCHMDVQPKWKICPGCGQSLIVSTPIEVN